MPFHVFMSLYVSSCLFMSLVVFLCLPAGAPAPPEGAGEVSALHREAFGDSSHQRAEDSAADLRAVAAQPQAAGPSVAADGRAAAPRLQDPPHPGGGAQLQGQGEPLA